MTPRPAAAQPRELVIVREFDAPPERVWQAWTEPRQLKRWISPADFSVPVYTLDLRVGGRYLLCMRGPDGNDIWSTGTYREIVPGERLVITDCFADQNGNPVPPSHYGMPGDAADEYEVTVTFEALDGGRTRLTLRHVGLPAEVQEGATTGWNGCFDKLAALLR